MTRTPVGTRPQPEAASAVAAHIASRLAGLGSARGVRDAWLRDELQVRLRSNGLDRAAARVRDAITPWLLVVERGVLEALDTAFVVFPGAGRARPGLIAALRSTQALRQLLVTRSRRDVICVLLFERQERDELFATIEELGESFVWDEILDEDRRVEVDVWVALTRRMAAREGLLERSE
jgi:hypothetical protein